MTLARRAVATVEESVAALRRLSDSDLRRLRRVAQIRVTGLHALDWEDLLHEAIVRMLDGSRRWPRDVPVVVFLQQTMRSIASDHWRRLEKPVVVVESEIRADGDADGGGIDNTADMGMQPERRILAAEMLARIEGLFSGDADARAVIDGMVRGKSPGEIQEETGMNGTRYASTQRRIRRALAREFPDRGELT